MKFTVENLGPIPRAELELGDLTLICGANNTGKTYIAHALFAYLQFLREAAPLDVDTAVVEKLWTTGRAEIRLDEYLEKLPSILEASSIEFKGSLARVFGAGEALFRNSLVSLDLGVSENASIPTHRGKFGSAEQDLLSIDVNPSDRLLRATLLVDREAAKAPDKRILRMMLAEALRKAVLQENVCRPFIASAERTGAAIFQKELDFTRNRLVGILGDQASKLDPTRLLSAFSAQYPMAVEQDVDFVRSLSSIALSDSSLVRNHPDVLDDFAEILGGDYVLTSEGVPMFRPKGNKRLRLALVESSSAVRSLLVLGFYLRHVAAPGDLLIIDEPELNLHPANQRRMARLLARLANLGIRVLVTTHSDYIVRELNTLIMLRSGGEQLARLAAREGYSADELLSHDAVKAYSAGEAMLQLNGHGRRVRRNTLVPSDVSERLGIEVGSFDQSINELNRIQDEIIWGAVG